MIIDLLAWVGYNVSRSLGHVWVSNCLALGGDFGMGSNGIDGMVVTLSSYRTFFGVTGGKL